MVGASLSLSLYRSVRAVSVWQKNVTHEKRVAVRRSVTSDMSSSLIDWLVWAFLFNLGRHIRERTRNIVFATSEASWKFLGGLGSVLFPPRNWIIALCASIKSEKKRSADPVVMRLSGRNGLTFQRPIAMRRCCCRCSSPWHGRSLLPLLFHGENNAKVAALITGLCSLQLQTFSRSASPLLPLYLYIQLVAWSCSSSTNTTTNSSSRSRSSEWPSTARKEKKLSWITQKRRYHCEVVALRVFFHEEPGSTG